MPGPETTPYKTDYDPKYLEALNSGFEARLEYAIRQLMEEDGHNRDAAEAFALKALEMEAEDEAYLDAYYDDGEEEPLLTEFV